MSLGDVVPEGSTVKILRSGIGGAIYMKGDSTDNLRVGDLVNYYTDAIDKFTGIPKEDCIGLIVSVMPKPYIDELRKMARQRMKEMQNE